MRALFTPWRMAYLSAPKTAGCVFCDAQGGDRRAALVVHEGRGAFVLLNRFPYTNGHLMVAPRAHGGDLAALPMEARVELMDLLVLARGVLDRAYRPGGYNIGMNLGACAGAGIADHVHAHIVPRWEGDTNYMTVLNETRMIPEALEATWERLSALFRKAAVE
jgi:ATP adenylyltransferase